MKIWKVLIAPLTILSLSQAHAQTAPQAANRLTGGILLQDADYEAISDFDVEADMLVVGYNAGLNNKFKLGGGLGLMFDGELQNLPGTVGDGEGFRLFVNGQYDFAQKGATTFAGTFVFTHDQFDFSANNNEIDFKITEMKFGALAIHKVREFSLYGGLEVFLYSDGEMEGPTWSLDVERDQRLNLRLGAAFAVDNDLDLRVDLNLLSEQTLLLGVDYKI